MIGERLADSRAFKTETTLTISLHTRLTSTRHNVNDAARKTGARRKLSELERREWRDLNNVVCSLIAADSLLTCAGLRTTQLPAAMHADIFHESYKNCDYKIENNHQRFSPS